MENQRLIDILEQAQLATLSLKTAAMYIHSIRQFEVTAWNHQALTMLSVPEKDNPRSDIITAISKERDLEIALVRELAEMNDKKTSSEIHAYHSGTKKWFKLNMCMPVPGLFDLILSDITEAHRTEANFEHFFNINQELLSIVDTQGKFIRVNNRWQETLGMNTDQLVGKQFMDFVHPGDHERTRAAFQELLIGGIISGFENRYRHSDGSYHTLTWETRYNEDKSLLFASATDITKSVETTRQLSTEKERGAKLLAMIPGFVFQYEHRSDGNRYFPFISTGVQQVFGLSNIQVMENPALMIERIHPDDAPIIARNSWTTDELEIWEHEIRIQVPKKGNRWIFITARPERIGDDTVVWHGYVNDITERKRQSQEAIQQHLRMDYLIKATNAGTWRWEYQPDENAGPEDMEPGSYDSGRFFINERWAEILGYQVHELQVDSLSDWQKLSHPEDVPSTIEKLSAHFAGKTEYYENLIRMKHRDGRWIWIESRGRVTNRTGKGLPITMYGIHLDVTDKITYQNKIMAQKESLENIIEATQTGTYEWNIKDNSIQVNNRSLEMLGYEADSDKATSLDFFIQNTHEDDLEKCKDILLRHFKGELEVYQCEKRMKHRDGSWIWINDRGKVTSRSDSGEPLVMSGTYLDINKRKNAELALIQAVAEADEANRAKSEFLANMSHEIRTPLNGVIGFTELLSKTNLNSQQQQYVESAYQSGNLLLAIINDILDLSKIEAGKLELEIVPTDLVAVFVEAFENFSASARKKNLTFRLDLDTKLPIMVKADPLRLRQVMLNLIANAIKFTDTGSVDLKANLVRREISRCTIRISVEDTGIGIKPEQHKRLFRAFSQADNSTTRKFGGTGLGLIISNLLAEKMGSGIQFTSEYGKGSTFFFEIGLDVIEDDLNKREIDESIDSVILYNFSGPRKIFLSRHLKLWGVSHMYSDFDEYQQDVNAKNVDLVMLENDTDIDDMGRYILTIKNELSNSRGEPPFVIKVGTVEQYQGEQEVLPKTNADAVIHFPIHPRRLLTVINNLAAHKMPAKPSPEPIETAEHTTRIGRVLIVEDVQLNRLLLRSLIERIFPEVSVNEVQNGLEALTEISESNYDCVLMDVHMAEMDGITATKKIRAQESASSGHLPVIALTAGATKYEHDRCLKAGMDDFITKPIEPEIIQEILSRYLPFDTEAEADKPVGAPLAENDTQSDPARGPETSDHNDIFDISRLRSLLDNDEALEQELIRASLGDLDEKMAQLKLLLEQKNTDEIREMAHTIKGQSATMQYGRLKILSEKLEDFAADKNVDEMLETGHAVLESWAPLRKVLSTYLLPVQDKP